MARLTGARATGARAAKAVLALATAAGVLTVLSASTASTASAAPAPIKLAFVTSLTGPGAPEYQGADSVFKARLDVQNAKGGIHGHKLVPIIVNDETSPTAIVTGVQGALSKGAFGIVSDSALFFLAAKYPQAQGVPVTGSYEDGPEWGTQPYTNMFASDQGSVDPTYPVNTGFGKFVKEHGGTVLGSYGYGISPTSTNAAYGAAKSFEAAGGKVGVLNVSVPFGGVDFTTDALVAKSKHVNALTGAMDDNSNFALATAMEQAGVKLKAVVWDTGYEPSLIHSPAWKNVQGDFFLTEFRPFVLPNAGTRTMAAALRKYAHFAKSQFPTYSQYEAWLGADLMIKGLELAGKHPTRAAVIKDLRRVKSYDGGGLLADNIDYSTDFGHSPKKMCVWYMQAKKSGFALVTKHPFCSGNIPGSTSKTPPSS